MFYIGDIRRWLLREGSHRWNAWIRDLTARLEGTRLVRSQPFRNPALQEMYDYYLQEKYADEAHDRLSMPPQMRRRQDQADVVVSLNRYRGV